MRNQTLIDTYKFLLCSENTIRSQAISAKNQMKLFNHDKKNRKLVENFPYFHIFLLFPHFEEKNLQFFREILTI